MGLRSEQQTLVHRVLQAGLISAIVVGVLAFGGTEPLLFSGVQVLILGLLLLFVVVHRQSDDRELRPLPLVPLFLIGLSLLQLIPLPVSLTDLVRNNSFLSSGTGNAPLSVAPYATQVHLTLLLTYCSVFYLSFVVSSRSTRGMKWLVIALLSLGLLEALVGLTQHLTSWEPLHALAGPGLKPVGTYINRNHYAGFLEMVLPFSLGLMLYQADLGWGSRSDHGAHSAADARIQKGVFWFVFSTLIFLAIAFSQSRMGAISAFCSVLFVCGLIILMSRRSKMFAVLAMVLFVGTGALMTVWIGVDPLIERFGSIGEEYGRTGLSRWTIWEDVVRLVGYHFWLGSGFGTFPVAYPLVQTAFLRSFVNHAHNDYLELFSEAGVVGGVLVFGSFLYLIVRAAQCLRETKDRFTKAVAVGCAGALFAILLHSLTDFNLYIPGNVLVLSVVCGMAYSCARMRHADTHKPSQ